MDDNLSNGWVKVYHPSGLQVTLPVPADGKTVSAETASAMLASINNYLGAGWLVNLPGLEEGETREDVSHLVRRSKANDDGTETPLIDVYTGGNFRVVSIYLNSDEDHSAFREAFGKGYDQLPVYDGTAPIERGKNASHDAKYVRAVSGAAVVWKLNPKYEGEQDKKHPKRVFVRWDVTAQGAAPQAKAAEPVLEGQLKSQAPAGLINGTGVTTPAVNSSGVMSLAYDEYYKKAQDKRFNLTTQEARAIARYAGIEIEKATRSTDFSRAFGWLPYFAEAKAGGFDLDTSMSILTAASMDTGRALESVRRQSRN